MLAAPEELPALAEVLAGSLEVLQAIFQSGPGSLPTAWAAILDGLRAAAALAAKPDDADARAQCNMATSVLRRFSSAPAPGAQPVAAPVEQTPASAPAAPALVAVDLGDVVARLLTLSPTDTDDLKALHACLLVSLNDAAHRPGVTDLLRQGAQNLRAGRLDEAADLLNQAIRVNEGKAPTPGGLVAPMAIESPVASAEPEPPSSPPARAQAAAPAAARETPSACLPADADLTLVGEYITECLDHITSAEGALLGLETCPDNNEELNRVFRAFHTVKGTSGMLGLAAIQGLAHLAENMLDRARAGEIKLTGGYADLALQSCDVLKDMISALSGAQPGQELPLPDEYAPLCERLSNPEGVGVSENVEPASMRVGDILVGQSKVSREHVEAAAETPGLIGQALIADGSVKAADVGAALRTQKQLAGAPSVAAGAAAEQTVRINTTRLDSLVNMVGELVIAQSMVAQDQDVISGRMARLQRSVSHAGKIVRELQDLTMGLRMVPLKATFQKMARLVRDLAHKSGKNVQFVTEGDETEIDRNMVEVLNDPLVHMIRNSVDHGIESADVRAAAGKAPLGTVRLRAYHAAGSVVLELTDDGKGLDRQRILAKAVDRGLVHAGQDLTDSQIYELIFHPGLSTAEKVTDVSGRGVGMDVVKKGVESVRGRIDVTSQFGQGSTFALRLPLTMAIVDAMLLRVGDRRFLMPTVSIEHSFRPQPEALTTAVGQTAEMVTLRGQLLPLFRLHRLFGIDDTVTDPTQGLVIVIEANGRRCALLADELLGQQQVVIKPLGESLRNIPGVAGGAILGDGRVGIILDAAGVWSLATGNQQGKSAA